MINLAPSILSADFSQLAADVKKIENAGADLIHVDVMDGHFVPNISYGATVMKSLCGKSSLPFDVHLMIEDPDKYAEDFLTDQTEYITVHQEACPHINRTVQHIRSLGVKPGVAVNPGTPVATLEYVIEDVDLVLIMSVNPGFGGQKFIPSALRKIRELKDLQQKHGLDFRIEVDGGVGLDNAADLIDAGADILVAGSSVFKADDVQARVKEFLQICR